MVMSLHYGDVLHYVTLRTNMASKCEMFMNSSRKIIDICQKKKKKKKKNKTNMEY